MSVAAESSRKSASHPTRLQRGYVAIGLSMPKTPANVGSVLRAAGCFGVALVVTSGQRYTKAPTDVGLMYRHIPLLQVPNLHDAIPYDCVPVAVELCAGAKALPAYTHPERAFYVFGPEDGSLGCSVLDWCRDCVMIPTNGCLNLAASVNVVLYDRLVKRSLHG